MSQHRARKRFGQNFLHDEAVILRIINAIAPRKGDHVVEIGPGQGALTTLLLDELGEMDAVELDRDLVPILARNCAAHGTLNIHNVDALRFDFSSLAKAPSSLRVVGNLPYNISTPLIFHLLSQASSIRDMYFMLQREVVERMAAQPGGKTYGRLSIMVQYHCEVENLFIVGPESFDPMPKIDSAIVRLTPRSEPAVKVSDEALFAKVVTQAFSQRRKTIRNTLKPYMTSDEINALEIDPSLRAEVLSLEIFARITNYISENQPPEE
ncbi:MAG: 16S rRNA (adenine(1518)-N(6)/adenine(1519)-N(6))-dimethyltransferase RsmA [Thiotrichaceae bacterium]|nr:16S rRNA (adenine(1518)-N(6)/adenine(1519)-N(6))-dimethyltransferase RsmA [Thiotrichaceae bacterium]